MVVQHPDVAVCFRGGGGHPIMNLTGRLIKQRVIVADIRPFGRKHGLGDVQ